MPHDELQYLRSENARLIALLESHGIEWRIPQNEPTPPERENLLTTEEKIVR